MTATLACGFWIGARPAAAEDAAAVLVAVTGPVEVVRGSETRKAAFGDPLQDGDVVQTGKDALAGIIFPSGQIIEVGATSKLVIRGGKKPDLRQAGAATMGVMADVPDAAAAELARYAAAPPSDGKTAVPSLRSDAASELVLLEPRRTRVVSGAATFRWTPVEQALAYRVRLSGDGKASGEHESSKPEWTIPADQTLAPGSTWTWSVEAVTPDGSITSDDVSFEVAPADVTTSLSQHRERLQPLLTSGDPTRQQAGQYLLASVCRNLGFYQEAIQHYETLNQTQPRPELHQQIGELYAQVGRYDRATEEFRRALQH